MSDKCEWKDGRLTVCSGLLSDLASDTGSSFRRNDCPYCKTSFKKPIEIKVGQFGKFWDDDEESGSIWGFLDEKDFSSEFIYRDKASDEKYANFVPYETPKKLEG